jgi:hypothetical protein
MPYIGTGVAARGDRWMLFVDGENFTIRGHPFKEKGPSGAFFDGAYRDRTGDLRLAKPALSQLS